MTTTGTPTRAIGHGPIHDMIIQAVAQGQATDYDLRRVCKPRISGSALRNVLDRMCEDRLLVWVPRRGRYQVGPKGRGMVRRVTVETPAWMRTFYVPPPAPFRRPGSDHSHLPSRATEGHGHG